MKNPKVWFITGTSRGFGRIWTEAALKRGDKVIATARNLDSIADFNEKYGGNVLTLELDITNESQVKSALQRGFDHFGKLDIVFNNAGYSLVGTIEEATNEEVKAMYETNVFGPLTLIRAALPILRQQGYGHILGTSSGLGHTVLPVIGYYCSTKWAFEAIHESLAAEVAPFNIKVTIVEPGAYATEFGTQDSLKFAPGLDFYEDFKTAFFAQLGTLEKGNPEATPDAIFAVVDAENPPLRMILGNGNLPWIKKDYAARMEEWEKWAAISNAAQN